MYCQSKQTLKRPKPSFPFDPTKDTSEIGVLLVGKTEDGESGEQREYPFGEQLPNEDGEECDVEKAQFLLRSRVKEGVEHGNEREDTGVQHLRRVKENGWINILTNLFFYT